MTQEQDKLLFSGTWSDEVKWEFYATKTLPPSDLCTAVFCLPFKEDKILLVENPGRNWDFTGGHIEDDERDDITKSIHREVLEEGSVSIENPHYIGYRKIISTKPQRMKTEGKYYPFPNAYIPFYIAMISTIHTFTSKFETIQRKLFTPDEAMFLLQRDLNYKIVEYAFSIKNL